jgi:hypothetical protein
MPAVFSSICLCRNLACSNTSVRSRLRLTVTTGSETNAVFIVVDSQQGRNLRWCAKRLPLAGERGLMGVHTEPLQVQKCHIPQLT